MADIRLDETFLDHPKTHKLKRRLGLEGQSSLITLWIWCAKNRPNGSLAGMDAEDIAIAARWDGDANVWVSTLEELRWLDKTDNGYTLHHWKERNPWAADAKNRADKARLSRLASVNPEAYKRYRSEGREGITAQEFFDAKSDKSQRINNTTITNRKRTVNESLTTVEHSTTSRTTPTPSPDPSPTPKPAPSPNQISEEREISDPRKTTTTARARAKDDDEAGKPPPDDPSPDKMPLSRACELYRTCFAGNHLQIPQVTADKLKTLIARYSRADLEAAFDAAANSGAKSLKYLEATIEGKRQNKEPTAKRRAKKGESDNGWRCKDITGHWNPEGRGERGISRPADSRTSPWGDIGAITTEELDACIDAGLGTGRLSNAPIQPGAG